MSAHFTRQYNPVSTQETSTDDPLSVRSVADLADGVNNYRRYVTKWKICGQPCIPWWYTHDSTTEERVIGVFAPRTVPMGYKKIVWALGHIRTSPNPGDPSDIVTWRIYCDKQPYYGPVAMDTDYLSSSYTVTTLESTSLTHDIDVSANQDLVIGGGGNAAGSTYIVITGENSSIDVRGALTCFDIWIAHA